MERYEIDDEDSKYKGDKNFGGRANWDTYETSLVFNSDEMYSKQLEAWSDNFNRKLRAGEFDMEKAQKAVRKYLLPEAKKLDPDIDISKVDTRGFVREIVMMKDPLPPRKKDYVPKHEIDDSALRYECESKHMDYVPGYHKDDGTYVKPYCRHTKFTDIMNRRRR